MIGIDTNILLRLLLVEDVGQHRRAKVYILEHCTREQPGYISVIVLCELMWTLHRSYRFDRNKQAQVVQALLDVENMVVEDHDLVRIALTDFRSSSLGFADCLMGRRNARAGCKHTITFDKAASKLDSFELPA